MEASQAMLHVLETTQGSLVQKTNAPNSHGCNQQFPLTQGQGTSDNSCDGIESLCSEVLL